MAEPDNNELLARYARDRSEEAFAALVARHVNLVYSVALRHVADPQQAQDITQAVFLLLAKKAGSLSPQVILSGWLYRTARLTAANYLRMENRRQRREQEVHMQASLNEPEPDLWAQIAPELDAAMGHLGPRERDAVVLRFFEGKSLREVGTALGASEAAAQKSVERALKKLRDFFARRGLSLSAAALMGALSVHAVQAAPAGLGESIMAAGIAHGTVAGGPSLALMKSTLKLMTWLKIKTVAVAGLSAVLIAGAATVTISQVAKNRAQESRSADVAIASAATPLPITKKERPSVLNKQDDAESPGDEKGGPVARNQDVAAAPVDSQDATAWIRRGKLDLASGDDDHAIADFNQALRLDSGSAAAYFGRGRAGKLKGDYAQALADYNDALRLNPSMVAAYVNRGQIYNMAHDRNRAIADFDQAIRLDSQRPIPYLDRGVAHVAKGDYAQALTDFDAALKLEPDLASACNNRAWLRATCPDAAFRNGPQAVENAMKACALSNWKNISQIDTLAAAYAEAGDFDNAVKWETQVLATPGLAPEDVAIAKDRLALYQAHQPYHRKPPANSSEVSR